MSGGHFSCNSLMCLEDELTELLQQPLHEYSDDTVMAFENGLLMLKMARVYAKRIDYLISGDDGEESFHKRLKEDLSEIVPSAEKDFSTIPNKILG